MKKTTEAKQRAATPTPEPSGTSPALVKADLLIERSAEIARDTAQKAFEYFCDRGGELGYELEDWLRAENELLRPVPVEVTETDDAIFVNAAVAGFKPQEIEVSVEDGVLIISGATETSEQTADANTIVREWSSNRLYRQLPLPSDVIADKVTANLTDGMLLLTLPKAVGHEALKAAATTA